MKMFNPFKQEYEDVTYHNMWQLEAYDLFSKGFSAEKIAERTPLTIMETRRIESQLKVCL